MEKEKQMVSLPYVGKVDVTLQTYRKALFDCIGTVSEILKGSSAFLSPDVTEYISLLNMLNVQLIQVDAFLVNYKQTEEAL